MQQCSSAGGIEGGRSAPQTKGQAGPGWNVHLVMDGT